MKRLFSLLLLTAVLCGWSACVSAARQYTITQSPAAPVQFDMGSTQTLTYAIANTSNGGNICERIYEMRFRLPGTGTVFSAATAAPANWTRVAFSATSVTFRVNSWNNSIDTPAGGGKSCATGQGAVTTVAFNLVLVMRTTTADVSETLRDARASFTLDTNFGNGITRTARPTVNTPGAWQLKSLQITSFQTTDTAGTPISAIGTGTNFRVVLTIRNISSATQSNIVSNLNPPQINVLTGAVSLTLNSTVYSPSPLTLNAGVTGTITFTYTATAGSNGTITFSVVNVRNGANNATSRSATSNVLSVNAFAANVNVSTTCFYIGNSVTVSMDYINSNTFTISGITASMAPSVGGIVTLISGPTYNATSVAANSTATNAVNWVYQLTGGTTGQLITFNGTATGNANPPGSGTRTTPSSVSAQVTRAGFDPVVTPGTTNVSSTYAEINWSITNSGCAPVQTVAITMPAGWIWNGDAYSIINGNDENWTISGSNPVTFNAPAPANQLPLATSAEYSLVLDTPSATGSYAFSLGITDANGIFSTRPITVIVAPFGSGTPNLNQATPGQWREEFR